MVCLIGSQPRDSKSVCALEVPANRLSYPCSRVTFIPAFIEVYEKAKSRNANRWSGETRNWDYIDRVWLNPPKGKSDEVVQIAA